jgi:lipoprotein-releasing system permease protein
MRKTNLKVAKAHLTSRVKQALVATLSVTFGISMYIFMNSFMTGVNDVQTDLAFTTLAHIRIYNDLPEDETDLLTARLSENQRLNLRNPRVIQYTQGIRNAAEITHGFRENKEIAAYTEQVNDNVFFQNGATRVNGQLSGIDAARENLMFGTASSMVEGHWHLLDQRTDGIILGIGLARKLGVSMGDNVKVSTGEGTDKNFEVIGILETTLANIDNAKAYVQIRAARQLLQKNLSYVTDVQVNLLDYERSERVAQQLQRQSEYKVEAWSTANGQLVAGNELRNIIAVAVSLTILLVAGFGIYNIMNMTVNEKIKEISILKAMGFEGRDIVEIFLVQSIIIGVVGGLIGLVLGGIVSVSVNNVPFEIPPLKNLPMTYALADYLAAFGFGLLTTLVAGYLPAKKASKVDPVTIIRG